MTQPKNKTLQKLPQNKPAPIEPEVVQPSTSESLINAAIIQILVEKDDPDEIERLMKADLDYNKKRFEILRENAALHPTAIEDRETKKFRRWQYKALIALLFLLVGVVPFVPLAVGWLFGILCILIVSGVLINAREREIDVTSFVKIISTVLRRKQ